MAQPQQDDPKNDIRPLFIPWAGGHAIESWKRGKLSSPSSQDAFLNRRYYSSSSSSSSSSSPSSSGASSTIKMSKLSSPLSSSRVVAGRSGCDAVAVTVVNKPETTTDTNTSVINTFLNTFICQTL